MEDKTVASDNSENWSSVPLNELNFDFILWFIIPV